VYFISDQNVFTYDGMRSINSKAIVNLRVAYNFWKEHQIFINARNLFHDNNYEFLFADQVGSELLFGLKFYWSHKKKSK